MSVFSSTHNRTAAKDTNLILGEIIIIIHLKTYRPHRERKNLKVVCSVWRNLRFSLACEYDKNEVPEAQSAEDISENKTDQIKSSCPLKSPSQNCMLLPEAMGNTNSKNRNNLFY